MYNMTKEDAKKILADLIDNPFLHTWEEQNKALHMAISALSTHMVSRKDFEPVDNKLYLNPVCRNCKYSDYCNCIPTDENNEDIEHYDAYGRPVLSVRECKDYEPESDRKKET